MSSITIENRERFLTRLRMNFDEMEIDEIMYAYDIAKEVHRRFGRDTGERYFEHPRACALILLDEVEGFISKEGVIILLLHDTGEDTPIFGSIVRSYDEFKRVARFRIGKTFSEKIAEKLLLLTKPSLDNILFHSKEEIMKYYIDNLFLDDEAVFYKMIDRLHNLRTLSDNQGKIQKTLEETKTVYLDRFAQVTVLLSDLGNAARILLEKIKKEIATLECLITPVS